MRLAAGRLGLAEAAVQEVMRAAVDNSSVSTPLASLTFAAAERGLPSDLLAAAGEAPATREAV